uniref:Uncharacterized protein n=1 Tax=Tanacetum cinerariifolium TaxID=118510 RepID=A0A6L2MWY3_TANCI|nr:hypothetical protein [Tanacetum cinerariifolium]
MRIALSKRNRSFAQMKNIEKAFEYHFPPTKKCLKSRATITYLNKGLKLNLQRELLVSKPTTLGDAFSLAHITEAQLDDQSALAMVEAMYVNKPLLLSMPPQTTSNGNTKPLSIKWISSAERQERLNRGLCFNCNNKWVRGHKCPGKFLMLTADEDDDTIQESKPDTFDATKSGDVSILNSFIRQGSLRSLQLLERIGFGDVHELVDNEGIHNFVQPNARERMSLQAMVTGQPYQWVGESPKEATWEWMFDSQSAYSPYHLEGKLDKYEERMMCEWDRRDLVRKGAGNLL